MARNPGQVIDFFKAYQGFLKASRTGRRLQPNGKRVSPGTLNNYEFTLKVVEEFCRQKQFDLRLKSCRWLNSRSLEAENNYWKRFYKAFSDYLYEDRGYYDNYAGQVFKNIKVFFNYLNREKLMDVGMFHRKFYVRKEEITIYPLSMEELKYLTYDKAFENSLSENLKQVKDFFVFGCTVGLRFSDLVNLRPSNLRRVDEHIYLVTTSIKTGTETILQLPAYCTTILDKYPSKRKKLLPHFNKSNLNKYIKQLLLLAGFVQPVDRFRTRRGQRIAINRSRINVTRFCDVASTHTMRRTAITNMLSQGVPQEIVRRISGHAPGSKDFYRYVSVSQAIQDRAIREFHERMEG